MYVVWILQAAVRVLSNVGTPSLYFTSLFSLPLSHIGDLSPGRVLYIILTTFICWCSISVLHHTLQSPHSHKLVFHLECSTSLHSSVYPLSYFGAPVVRGVEVPQWGTCQIVECFFSRHPIRPSSLIIHWHHSPVAWSQSNWQCPWVAPHLNTDLDHPQDHL